MQILRALERSRHTLPAFAAEGVFWAAFAVYAPPIKRMIGASDADFGLVLLAVSAMWLAPLFDRLVGRFAMAAAAIVLAIAYQLLGLALFFGAGVLEFALLMGLAGAASGVLDVVMNARLSAIESRVNQPLMNLNHAAFSFAYAASAIASGFARAQGIAPWVMFAALAGVLLLSTPAMVSPRFGPSPARQEQPGASRLPVAVLLGGAIIFAGFLAENATEGWSALHIERSLGGGAAQGAAGPAMLGLAMGFGRLGGQFIAMRCAQTRVVFWAAILSTFGAVLAAVAPSPPLAYVGFGVLGLGVSVLAPMVFSLIGQRVSDGQRVRAISRAAVIGYFGFFIGPPMMGFIAQTAGLRASFLFVAAVLALIPALLRGLRSSERLN